MLEKKKALGTFISFNFKKDQISKNAFKIETTINLVNQILDVSSKLMRGKRHNNS